MEVCMKKMSIALLVCVLTLSAVEWNIEQVTEYPDLMSFFPVIAVDLDGKARIFFGTTDTSYQSFTLKTASNASGSWVIKEVSDVLIADFSSLFYGVAVDSNDNTLVTYSVINPLVLGNDIYLASDSSGSFTVTNLSDDFENQTAPSIVIDRSGKVHIVWLELNPETELYELRHGWLEGVDFESERITDNIFSYETPTVDVALGDDDIYVFYPDSNGYLFSASRPLQGSAGWDLEQIAAEAATMPSGYADMDGNLHVSYRKWSNTADIYYATNKSGSWNEELVLTNMDEVSDTYEWPCLAPDQNTSPHLAWIAPNDLGSYDIYYASKASGWSQEQVTNTPEEDELGGIEHFFTIDNEGYGHISYMALDEAGLAQVFYARSSEPLATWVTENPADDAPSNLDVKGSAIRFTLSGPSLVELTLYDASGRKVESLVSGYYLSGEHEAPVKSGDLSRGIYFVRGKIGSISASVKFVLIR